MKHLVPTLLIFIVLLFLTGCECYPVRKGIIVDEITHLPIENAQIQFGTSKTFSNMYGQFEISASSCNLKMTVTKDNYKPFGIKLTGKNEKTTIQIDNEINYKDLEKPKNLNSDSTSFLVVQAVVVNSVHFEYIGTTDSLKIYLKKK